MKVLVNAMSIKVGGALVLLEHIIAEMVSLRPDIDWHLALNPLVSDFPVFKREGVTVVTFPDAEKTPFHNSWFYLYTLPDVARTVKADVIFSMTNYLPLKLDIPSLLLVHNAGFFSEVYESLYRQGYPGILSKLAWWVKRRRIIKSVRRADIVTVQTVTMAKSLSSATGLPLEKIVVVPHGPGVCERGSAHVRPASRIWRIGILTTPGVQKNFEDLFSSALCLLNAGENIRIVITLDPEEPLSREVLARAGELGVSTIIENHGSVSSSEMQELYDSLDIFVFTSLCESFGFPMVEAMSRGLPLVVAETPGNLEVCGEDVICYVPGDHIGLAEKLTLLMSDVAIYDEASARSIMRSRLFSWHKAAAEICEVIQQLHLRDNKN